MTLQTPEGKQSRGEESLASSGKMSILLFTILALGLLVRVIHFWALSRTAFYKIPLMGKELDMYANWQWAQTILSGDILGRNTYHPYFDWMKAIASLDTWHRWWGGKEIFQQAPLYPYWVAGLLALSGSSLKFVLFIQLVVGACQPLVMFLLAKRLFDERAGVVAAALAAFYGPFIFHQETLLRDWLPPILEPLALLLLIRARAKGLVRDWLLAGMVLGIALLAKETVMLFLPLVALWVVLEDWGSVRPIIVHSGVLVLGLAVGLSPLFFRNVMVGAPVWAVSNRAAEGIIEGNAADAFPVGLSHPDSMKGILERSGGKVGIVIRETLETYRDHWLAFIRMQIFKLRGLIDSFEVPNNLNFYYGLEISPVLRFTLTYGLLFPFALAGLAASVKAGDGHHLLVLYGLSTLAALMTTIIIARYRLALVPVLITYAAGGLAWLYQAIREMEVAKAGAYIGLCLALALIQQFLIPLRIVRDRFDLAVHSAEYGVSATIYSSEGRYDRAVAEMEKLQAKVEKHGGFTEWVDRISLVDGDYRVLWARQLINENKLQAALEQVDLASACYARHFDLAAPNYNLGALYFRLGQTAKARGFLERFLTLEPQGPRAEIAWRLLSKLDASRSSGS